MRFNICLIFVFLMMPNPLWAGEGKGTQHHSSSHQDARYKAIFKNYEVERIDTLAYSNTQILFMERAFVYTEKERLAPIERIQFRDEDGYVVAHTPTRLSTIPFCFSRDYCWIFMWKTVYPLPAIFKFNADSQTWIHNEKPFMQYSRSRYAGEGFTEVINPAFGLVGVFLFYVSHFLFFSVVVLLSVVLCLQIVKFHDIPEEQKKWYHRIFFMINSFNPTYIPIEPYMLTAIVAFSISALGMLFWGIPSTLIVFTIMVTFFYTAMKVAKMKVRG